MKAEERLWWYSRFFDCVEVNSTFYAPLSAQNAVRWAKRTPPGFLFSVKAYALLTGHHLDAGRLPPALAALLPASARPNDRGQIENGVFGEDAREWAFAAFREGAAAAGRRGQARLRAVPDGAVGEVRATGRSSISRACPRRLPGTTIAVEFRDASWLPRHTEETLAMPDRARAGLRLGGRAADARLAWTRRWRSPRPPR